MYSSTSDGRRPHKTHTVQFISASFVSTILSSLVDLRHLVILKKSELDALQREYDCFEALEEECDEKAEAADRVIEELWGRLSTL